MKNNPKGYVSFVLHAHLPFVHHPESEDYLEEQWLYEAISETYIPLLLNFDKLVNEGASLANGKGGGKPDLAQAGGANNGQIEAICKHIEETILK